MINTNGRLYKTGEMMRMCSLMGNTAALHSFDPNADCTHYRYREVNYQCPKTAIAN